VKKQPAFPIVEKGFLTKPDYFGSPFQHVNSPGASQSIFIYKCAGNDHPGNPDTFFSGDVVYACELQ